MDAGYDYTPIYQQLFRIDAHLFTAYSKLREGEIEGFNQHFAPKCVREHSYRYESYDKNYKTIKYCRPKEWKD